MDNIQNRQPPYIAPSTGGGQLKPEGDGSQLKSTGNISSLATTTKIANLNRYGGTKGFEGLQGFRDLKGTKGSSGKTSSEMIAAKRLKNPMTIPIKLNPRTDDTDPPLSPRNVWISKSPRVEEPNRLEKPDVPDVNDKAKWAVSSPRKPSPPEATILNEVNQPDIKSHTVSLSFPATPEFLGTLEKTNNVRVFKFRKPGPSATAPVALFALKNGSDDESKKITKEDVAPIAILKYATESPPSMKRRMEKSIKSTTIAQQRLGMRRPSELLPTTLDTSEAPDDKTQVTSTEKAQTQLTQAEKDQRVAASKAFGEVLAYRMSEFLGSKTVPETHFVDIDKDGKLEIADKNKLQDDNKKLTTVQQFAPSTFKKSDEHINEDSAKDEDLKNPNPAKMVMCRSTIPVSPTESKAVKKLAFRDNLSAYTEPGLQRFQKCAVDSYIFGGLDCHPGNLLTQKNAEGKYDNACLIDNGNSFPVKFPGKEDTLILNNYCGWAKHPLASVPLDEETKGYIRNIKTDEVIHFLKQQQEEMRGHCKIGDIDHADIYYQDAMITNLIIRVEVLKKIAGGIDEGKTHSLEDLATVKTYDQTKAYLGEDELNAINNYVKTKLDLQR